MQSTNSPVYFMRPSKDDPENSWSVFEKGRLNSFGEPYCVLPSVTYEEARKFINLSN